MPIGDDVVILTTMDERTTDRNVAIVTYFFPPLGGVGVRTSPEVRTLLAQIRVEARNLTRHAIRRIEITDPALMNTVPRQLEVHRSFILEPSGVYRRLAGMIGRLRRAVRPSSAPPQETAGPGDFAVRPVAPLIAKAYRGLARVLFFPDEHLVWIPFAIRSIRAANRRRHHDAIVSSSPLSRRTSSPGWLDPAGPHGSPTFAILGSETRSPRGSVAPSPAQQEDRALDRDGCGPLCVHDGFVPCRLRIALSEVSGSVRCLGERLRPERSAAAIGR